MEEKNLKLPKFFVKTVFVTGRLFLSFLYLRGQTAVYFCVYCMLLYVNCFFNLHVECLSL